MDDVQVPLQDFLVAAGQWLRPVSLSTWGDRYFSRIQFLTEDPPAAEASGTLWICPARTLMEQVTLDPWILQLSRHGAVGLIVVGDQIASATRLLANRLQLPLMAMRMEHMGPVMDAAYRLLMGVETHRIRDELDRINQVQQAWRVSASLEVFCRNLDDHGISVVMMPLSNNPTVRVEWGRGQGTRFSLEPDDLSDRVVELIALVIGVFLDLDAAEIESALRHRAEFLLELLVDP